MLRDSAAYRMAKCFLGVATLGLFLWARPAAADSVTDGGVTLTLNTTNLRVTEGQSLTLNYTLTNNSGGNVEIHGYVPSLLFIAGDPSDIASINGPNGTCPSFSPWPSGSPPCTFSMELPTFPSSGESDGDFAVEAFFMTVDIYKGPHLSTLITPTLIDDITITDPPVTTPPPSTPEPSSLLLLGTGLLGLMGTGLYKKRLA